MKNKHPRDVPLLQSGAERVAPMELSRIPHSRFGSCAYDPVSGIQLDVEMRDEDTEVEVAARPQIILAAIPEEATRQLCGHGRNYQEDCPSCIAICDNRDRDRMASEDVEMLWNQQQSSLDFDDMPPSMESFAASLPPPLAQAPDSHAPPRCARAPLSGSF